MQPPGIWWSLLTTLLLAGLALFAWRRRKVSGALVFMVACGFSILWVGGSVGEHLASDVTGRVFWYKWQIAWQLPTLTALFCFVLEYTWPGRWLSRRNLLLLSLVPLALALLIVTDDHHQLMWVSLIADGGIAPVRGPVNWPFIAYGMGLGVVEVGVLVWLFVRSPAHRAPAALIILTLAGNRMTYLYWAAQHPLGGYISSEVTMVGVGALSFSIALFGFRILNPVTQAMQTTLAQMSDGILVLDQDGKVASINPAAGRILGVSTKGALGSPVGALLVEVELAPLASRAEQPPVEIGLTIGEDARRVVVQVSELRDWRGLVSGTMLMLRDVTSERQAQAQILQQQLTLATLTERERLARELHDSLGQIMAAAHMHVGTIRRLLDRGQAREADGYLQQLAEMTHDAEEDIREYILGARGSVAGGLPFFVVLRKYVVSYTQRFGIKVDVSVDMEERDLDPLARAQLLRIIQEALANVRKHARAGQVTLHFSLSDSMLEVVIADDGQGFDQAAVAVRPDAGYGMDTMRERAESIGGSLEVASAPGEGTRVTVQVPIVERGVGAK